MTTRIDCTLPDRARMRMHVLIASSPVDSVLRVTVRFRSTLRAFRNRTEAARDLGYASVAGFARRMDAGDALGKDGLFYREWDGLSDEMRAAYREELPRATENRAAEVERLDLAGEVVKTYPSMESVCHELQLSLRTLKRAIAGDSILRGSLWRGGTDP